MVASVVTRYSADRASTAFLKTHAELLAPERIDADVRVGWMGLNVRKRV